jgi:hypothetical protein
MNRKFTQLSIIINLILISFTQIIYSQAGTTCNNAILLECGGVSLRTFNTKDGKNNLTMLDYASCHATQNPFSGKELLFKINKTGSKTWFISLYNQGNIDLDMFLFDNCPLTTTGGPILLQNPGGTQCLQKSTNSYGSPSPGYNFDVLRIKTPGTYWIVVDGFNSSQEGGFTIDVGCDDLDIFSCNDIPSLNCNASLNGVNGCVCPGTFCICSYSKINKYNCHSSNIDGAFTGSENVYKFTASTTGEHTFDLKGFNTDLELFLISNACSPPSSATSSNSVYTCLAQSTNPPGADEKIAYNLSVGQTVYIVVDRSLDTGGNDNFNISVKCPVILPPETCENKCCEISHDYRECYGFENYALGNLLPQASPKFTLFNNTAGNAQVVNTIAKSGSRSLRFGSNSDIDLNIYRELSEIKVARLEWSMFTPNGKVGEWGLETNNSTINPIIGRINNSTLTIFKEDPDNNFQEKIKVSYPHNQWVKFALVFQPFENEIELWMDGKFVYKETGYMSNSINQLNYYFNQQNPVGSEFFIDDICYSEVNRNSPCTLQFDPVCINGKEYQNGCVAQRDGYSECEWIRGTCNSNMCMNCWNCFHFLQSGSDPLTYQFLNRFCDQGYIGFSEDRTNNRFNNNLVYEWSVENTNVTFTNNTNKNSINPFIRFPGFGTYIVCLKVFAPGSTTPIYTCCLKVFVSGNCIKKPIAHFNYASNSSNNSFTLNSGTSDGSGEILWDFSGSNVTFLNNTNKNSANLQISIPSGQCVDVCMSLSNDCGISTYCLTLCNNSTSCTGNTPIYTLNNRIEPVINDETISFTNLPTPPAGTNVEYIWDFGDDIGKSSLKNPTYKYPKPGRYIICLIIKIGCKKICYCWCVWINPCQPIFEDHMGMLFPKFLGNQTTLQYQIQSSNITIAPGQPWLVDDVPVTNSAGAANLTIALPQNKDYVICFPYLKPNGCLAYKCIRVRGGNPFLCTNIGWKYVQNSGFQFNLTQSSGVSDIRWLVDETGQQLGTSATSNFLLPPNPCGWRNISVIYFDGTRYWICCLRIYLCAPDDCFNSIFYGVSTNEQALFRLEEPNATNIQWYFDDAPNTVLGTSGNLILPYPGNCVAKWISVKYFIPGFGWKICCRLIWFCNPFNCNFIKMTYTEGSGFKFETDQTYQNMSWVIDETNQSLGSGIQSNFYPVSGTECQLRTVTVRYRDALGRWWLCCYRFWWCNPINCSDKIIITPSGTNHILSTENNLQNITWFRENLQLGTGNNLTTSLPSTGTYKIYIRYYNPSNKVWYWCCRSFTPGNGIDCNNMQVVFREDFSSGPPNGFGYALGQSIVSNSNWWMGESPTKVQNFRQSTNAATNRVGLINGGEILCLTFGKNLPNAQKIKVKFDIVGRWDNTTKPVFGGGFCLASEQFCYEPTSTKIFEKNQNLFNWCGASAVDGKYCFHSIEILIDRSGPVFMLIDGKPVLMPELNGLGSDITKINFSGSLEIDNFEVSTCDGGSSATPPWTPLPTGTNHTIIIPTNIQSNINGTPLKSGDYIGVFFNRNGQLVCSNYVKWESTNTSISAYGNDASAPDKNGFNIDEVFSFKVWRPDVSKEYNAVATYQNPPVFPSDATDKWKLNGISRVIQLNANGTVKQDITLRLGWNMISSYVIPENLNMLQILSSLGNKVALIKDEDGKATIPSLGINGIGNWDIKKGYQIRMTESSTLSIVGTKSDPVTESISISDKWKIISYLCDNGNPPAQQFASINNSLALVKDQDGKTYIPSVSIDNIKCMKPGFGYQVRGTTTTSFNYNCAGNCTPFKNDQIVYSRINNNSENVEPFNTGNNATLIINEDIGKRTIQIGDEIKIYNTIGLLCGKGKYEGSPFAISIWGDDPTTKDFIDGFYEGESFTTKINSTDGKLWQTELNFVNGNGTYTIDGIYHVESIRKTEITSNTEVLIYPNPTSNLINIQVESKEIEEFLELKIFDVQGKLIKSYTLDNLNKMKNLCSISTNEMDPGLYIFKIKIGSKNYNERVLVTK